MSVQEGSLMHRIFCSINLDNLHLFSIAGSIQYNERCTQSGRFVGLMAAPFGGYFILDGNSGAIDGRLCDYWGQSFIKGSLSGDHLFFNKDYFEYSNWVPFDYSFIKNGDLWIGEFVSVSEKQKGKASCRITHTDIPDGARMLLDDVKICSF
jgi:hypothetical protein